MLQGQDDDSRHKFEHTVCFYFSQVSYALKKSAVIAARRSRSKETMAAAHRSAGGRRALADDQLYTSIAGSTITRVIAGNRVSFTATSGIELISVHTAGYQIGNRCLRASL